MRRLFTLCLVLILSASSPAYGQDSTSVDVKISEVELEERARNIGRQLRCVACKNQSIEESPSGAAQEMRFFIEERLRDGYTDEAIIDELHETYGDFILLKPPFKPSTYLLWGLPFLLLLGAALWFMAAIKKYGSDPESSESS